MIEGSQTNAAELKKFGFQLSGLCVVFGIGIPFLKHHSPPIWPFGVGLPIALLAGLKPGWLYWVHRVWNFTGHYLGAINARILLGIFYFLIVVPSAMVLRFRKIDKMNRKFEPTLKTYRIERNGRSEKKQLERIF